MWVRSPKSLDVAHPVAKEPQPALAADPRVEQADAAGGDVSRVGERRQALAALQLVEPDQVGVGHVDFAADFEHRRHVAAAKAEAGRRPRCGRCG